jgi:hypothetical protein
MKPVLAVLAILFPQLAIAAECRFVSECYEADGCYETEYDLTLNLTSDTARVETIAGTFDAAAAAGDGIVTITGQGLGMMHMLTLADGGDARYAVQMGDASGVTMITYHGTCQ